MHRNTRKRRSPVRDEEEAFRRFNEVFDFDLFCLELELNVKIGEAIREEIRTKLGAKQHSFDTMLVQHPATLAESARHAEARRLEQERLEKIAERQSEREEHKKCAGVRHLARRWHAKVAPAHAS